MPVVAPTSVAAFDDAVAAQAAAVVYFRADWCEPCKHLDAVFEQLAADHPGCAFVRVEAEELMDVSERFAVEALPAFVALRGGKETSRLSGASAPALVELVAVLSPKPAAATAASAGASSAGGEVLPLEARLQKIIESAPNVLFMKGSPDAPRCGFSRQIVDLLNGEGVQFGHFDILRDEEVRQGLKAYSNWPTFPQLYANGKLVGGLDIVRELKEEGELKDSLAA
ncbi:thioredoxin-like protein [Pavlovales sp. CCMP2436]|nr:thioredoxin-like protein [Pavlovales sp. CCMP2436]|mmetsp:Transcript_15528/g.39448  ORF Transcript_15528/g.39448 Transcript_15528/m.39448 type:complete len:226 (-) Transcript_15528:248-925(-)